MIYRKRLLNVVVERLNLAVPSFFRKYQDHLKVLATAGFFMVPSVWSNSVFLSQFVPSGLALLAGIGLQCAITNLELKLLVVDSRRRSQLFRWLIVMLAGSVLASTLGFLTIQVRHEADVNAPARVADDLKKQSKGIAISFSEGKRLALSHWQNELDYDTSLLDKIRRRMMNSSVSESDRAAIPMFEQAFNQAKEQRDAWNAFTFRPADVSADTDPQQAFKALQSAYDQFSSLIGLLPRNLQQDFRMPDPPVPSIDAKDAYQFKTPIQILREDLFTYEGLLSLLLALFFEAVPLGLASASRNISETGFDDADEENDPTQASFEANARVATDWEVVAAEVVSPDASAIASFARRYRTLALGLANNMKEVMDNESSLAPAKDVFLQVSKMPLYSEIRANLVSSIEAAIEARLQQARRFGRPDEDLQKISEQGYELLSQLHTFDDEQLKAVVHRWRTLSPQSSY